MGMYVVIRGGRQSKSNPPNIVFVQLICLCLHPPVHSLGRSVGGLECLHHLLLPGRRRPVQGESFEISVCSFFLPNLFPAHPWAEAAALSAWWWMFSPLWGHGCSLVGEWSLIYIPVSKSCTSYTVGFLLVLLRTQSSLTHTDVTQFRLAGSFPAKRVNVDTVWCQNLTSKIHLNDSHQKILDLFGSSLNVSFEQLPQARK